MSWWTSIVDGVKSTINPVINPVTNSAKWMWNNPVSSTLRSFVAKTLVYGYEQFVAVPPAVNTLLNNENAQKIVSGSYHLAKSMALVIGGNVANNWMQTKSRDGINDNELTYTYGAFLSVLTVGSGMVLYYSYYRGAETAVEATVLNTFGPSAFNSNNRKTAASRCVELECNEKRKMKGMAREVVILYANEGLIFGISYLSPQLALVLKIINYGRFFSRTATPNRCDRHKDIEQEFAVSTGLAYEGTRRLMDYALESTVGMPPLLQLGALRVLLLLFHVNVVSHMDIPLANAKTTTIPIDVFNLYEAAWRYLLDKAFAGAIEYFKPKDGVLPFIHLSGILQFGTRLFNSDLEREAQIMTRQPQGWGRYLMERAIPPMFLSVNGFIRNPVVALYWDEMRQGGIMTLTAIETYGQKSLVKGLTRVPGVATALDYAYGIPPQLTTIIFQLSRKDDFSNLVRAINLWLGRHQPKIDVQLTEKAPLAALRGEEPVHHQLMLMAPSSANDAARTAVPPIELLAPPKPEAISADSVFSARKAPKASESSALGPDAFFSKKKKPPVVVASAPLDLPGPQ